jgi:Up-Regulated in long-lived daf-2
MSPQGGTIRRCTLGPVARCYHRGRRVVRSGWPGPDALPGRGARGDHRLDAEPDPLFRCERRTRAEGDSGMSYNSSATIFVTNNTGGKANIHLSHQYSGDTPQQGSWIVGPGENAGPLSVGYNTGFLRTGQDHWWVGMEVMDGPNVGDYSSEGTADAPGKICMLQSEDNGKTLTFAVDTSTFVMTEMSGSCSTSVSKSD